MFSKVRKHFNIVIVLALVYVICMLVIVSSNNKFYKSMSEDKAQQTATDFLNIKSRTTEFVSEASENIIFFEKVLSRLAQQDVVSMALLRAFDSINEMDDKNYELVNLLVFTQDGDFYDHANNGTDTGMQASHFPWARDMGEEYYKTRLTFQNDESTGDKYIIVSEKIETDDMIVAMCYRADDVSGKIFVAEKGICYYLDKDGNVMLSSEPLYLGENIYKKDRLFADNKKLLTLVVNNTGLVEVEKAKYYLSTTDFLENNKIAQLIPQKEVTQYTDEWYYKNVIFMIIISIMVVFILIKAYIATHKLKNVADAKYEYISDISNELKGYLVSVDSLANSLFNESKKDAIDAKSKYISDMSKMLMFRLNNVVHYAKMYKDDFVNEKGEYTAVEMANDIKKIVGCEIGKNKLYLDIQIDIDDRLKFYGDPNQVQAAIVSLLLMSIHTTVEGGIELKFSNDEMFGDRTNFIVTVKDTSPGMEEDDAQKMKEMVLNKRKVIRVKETGMGLDMVRMAIINMKGKFEITSSKNVGTEYVLKIPQVALVNPDEKFIKEQQEKREEAEDDQLNTNFWIGVDASSKESDSNGQENDDQEEVLTLSDDQEDDSKGAYMTLSDMGQAGMAMMSQQAGMANMNNMSSMNSMGNVSNMGMQGMPQMGNPMAAPMGMQGTMQANVPPMPQYGMSMNQPNMPSMGSDSTQSSTEPVVEARGSMSMDEMNKKYIEMMNASNEKTGGQSAYYQNDTINSMRLNTLYIDEEDVEEENDVIAKKKEKMYIYLKEDGINVDDGLDAVNKDVEAYEKALKEFYNYSHKNVRRIIGLWNEKKAEEYYLEVTKITTTALNIGANNLYSMLCEQQKNYNNGDMKLVSENVKTIFDEWKKILLYIVEYFKH